MGVSALAKNQYELGQTKAPHSVKSEREDSMRRSARVFVFFLLVTIGAASQHAQAANLSVNCDKHESIRKALHLLAATNPPGPNTITVSGSCNGNFVIQGMDRLTLITKKGASITDRSNESL